jgi:hypothetical protein
MTKKKTVEQKKKLGIELIDKGLLDMQRGGLLTNIRAMGNKEAVGCGCACQGGCNDKCGCGNLCGCSK